ncbi:MAG: YbhB/YbcL family Raf kinase inhibitor-like protein [Rhodoplanes sp.]
MIPIKSAVKPRANVNASGSCAACRDLPHDHRAKGIRALLGEEAAMRLSSSAFPDGGVIPRRFTCDGEDVSPPLEWTDVPSGARSLVLLCDDPDAPAGTWHHWAIYDIPADRTGLADDADHDSSKAGFKQAINDFRRPGYNGPCPPRRRGAHHYHFRLLPFPALRSHCARSRPAAMSNTKRASTFSPRRRSSGSTNDKNRLGAAIRI